MAQNIIFAGTAPNDRTGDKWRPAWLAAIDNFDQLFAFQDSQAILNISQESDFPVQTASTITLKTNIVHLISKSFTTTKNFVSENGAVFTALNIFGPIVTFTGSGSMFSGTDVDFKINDISISCPSAKAFDFADTAGGVKNFQCLNVRQFSGTAIATIDDYVSCTFKSFGSFTSTGIDIKGDKWRVFDVDDVAMISSSSSYVGIDFGTAILPSIKINDAIFECPAGAIGISGLANNGNVDSGSIATVKGCKFSGGMTDLQNITVDDVRWAFSGNSPTEDTFPDVLTGFVGNATETVIGVGSGDTDNPVPILATYVEERASHFTTTAAGIVKYVGERPLRGPIDFNFGLIPVGGGTKVVRAHLVKNSTPVPSAYREVSISGGTPNQVTIPWQDRFIEDDEFQIWLENRTDTANVIAEFGSLRIK